MFSIPDDGPVANGNQRQRAGVKEAIHYTTTKVEMLDFEESDNLDLAISNAEYNSSSRNMSRLENRRPSTIQQNNSSFSSRPISARGSRPTSAVKRPSGYSKGLEDMDHSEPPPTVKQMFGMQGSPSEMYAEDTPPTYERSPRGHILNREEPLSHIITKRKEASAFDIKDRRKAMMRPIPEEFGFFKCTITRNRSGLNKLFPRYYLYSEEFGDTKFLLSAKKRKNNKTPNYTISIDKEDMGRNSMSFLCKLRSNFLGTEFNIFDGGHNPSKKFEGVGNPEVRLNLGCILYESNLLGSKGPRRLTVVTPQLDGSGAPSKASQEVPSNVDAPPILHKYTENDWKHLKVMKNKSPVYNEKLKAFVLNFNQRISHPSVKNFQLVDPDDPEKVYLQFGKMDKSKFALDYRWPLTGAQAFCIAITALDSKLACE
ncbi:tubby protein [Acrasis kona]|uniref:Tubby protein n=1 Tax=Acrasis kona TaxID=1008807 RepID=A0AAW2Z044_9EUKA